MMKKMKIVASDIDGTLALKGGNLMPLTRKALMRLHEEGVLFGLASGRPIDHVVLDSPKQWDLGFDLDFAIGMNGGELYDAKTGKLEKYYLLPSEEIRKILTFLKPFDINAIIYVNAYEEIRCLRIDDFMRDSMKRNHSHVTTGDIDYLAEFPTGKIEVQFREKELEGILKAIEDNRSDAWSYVQTFHLGSQYTFEFQDPHVNKGVALKEYAHKYDIDLSDVMAFGDQKNDIGLLDAAGFGVCLVNGADESKAVSQAITEYDVEHDGVGHWLYDHYFKD